MKNTLFKTFPKQREDGLKKLYRYSAFEVMFYRSNLWDHSFRVSWLAEELAPTVRKHYKSFDAEKARVMALVHDDAELYTGDIQSRVKARATAQAKQKMEDDEKKAIEKLAKVSPQMVGGYVYKELLLAMVERTSVEAQIVIYADKLDAYCESLHEVLAGNLLLLQAVLFYPKATALLDQKFRYLTPILEDKSSVLTDLERYLDPPFIKTKTYLPFGKPFTSKTILLPSTIPFYDRWRKMVIERGGKEGLQSLIHQREFLPKQ